MPHLEQRIAALEEEVEHLRDWQRQIDTLLTIVAGATESIIEQDDDTR